MIRTMTLAGAMLVAGLSIPAAPAMAASLGHGATDGRATVAETVQYGYGRYDDRRRERRVGNVVRDVLGVGPRRDRGYRRGGRGYGYGRRDRYGY